jgi:hypothetical protein
MSKELQSLGFSNLIHDKRLRQQFCACRRPTEDFVDDAILKAMDAVEAAMAGD